MITHHFVELLEFSQKELMYQLEHYPCYRENHIENNIQWYDLNLPVYDFKEDAPCRKDLQNYVYNILFSYCKEYFIICKWHKIGFPTAGTVKHMTSFALSEKTHLRTNVLLAKRGVKPGTSKMLFDYAIHVAVEQEILETVCKEINDRITADSSVIIGKIIKFVVRKMNHELTHLRKINNK